MGATMQSEDYGDPFFECDVSVDGVLSSDAVIMDVKVSEKNTELTRTQIKEYSKIYKAYASNGKVSLKAVGQPTVSLELKFMILR